MIDETEAKEPVIIAGEEGEAVRVLYGGRSLLLEVIDAPDSASAFLDPAARRKLAAALLDGLDDTVDAAGLRLTEEPARLCGSR